MSQIDMKMSAIYQAAHDELPAKAGEFATKADGVTGAIEPLVAQVALAGNHPIGDDLATLGFELFSHLHAMVGTLNDTSVALDRIADSFVAVDAEAETWLQQHQNYLGDPVLAPVPVGPEV